MAKTATEAEYKLGVELDALMVFGYQQGGVPGMLGRAMVHGGLTASQARGRYLWLCGSRVSSEHLHAVGMRVGELRRMPLKDIEVSFQAP